MRTLVSALGLTAFSFSMLSILAMSYPPVPVTTVHLGPTEVIAVEEATALAHDPNCVDETLKS